VQHFSEEENDERRGLLKGHLRLEVSAVAMIDLDQGIRALTGRLRFDQGSHGVIAVFFYPLHGNCSFRPRFTAPRAGGCHILHSSHFSQGLVSGLSKQGPMFRNSYVTGHLWHEIARWPRGAVLIDGPQPP
jgi:hypothetical protein